MAASLPADNEFAPAEFSPTPELVRIAVIVLAVAGVAGLWKGAAEAIGQGPVRAPPPASSNGATPATAFALPTVGATADTLLPPQALGSTVATPPAPVKAAPRVESASEPEVAAPAEGPLIVEVAPAQPAAPAAAEAEAAPSDDLEQAPLADEAYPPD